MGNNGKFREYNLYFNYQFHNNHDILKNYNKAIREID